MSLLSPSVQRAVCYSVADKETHYEPKENDIPLCRFGFTLLLWHSAGAIEPLESLRFGAGCHL